MKNKDYTYLKCLSTGENLKYLELNNEMLKSLAKIFEETYHISVQGFLTNKSNTYYYPICSNVLIFLNGYYFKNNEFVHENTSLDPFQMFTTTDKEWYKNYDEIVSFKKNDILKIVNSNSGLDGTLVEYLSSSGELITYIKKYAQVNIKNYVAVDLDYYALKELAENDPSILTICSDATVDIFRKDSISIGISNSIHHIPEYTKTFYENVYKSLATNGLFIGIESQGFLSKIIINFISGFPRKMIPYVIKEIYNERVFIKKWLGISIFVRLKAANIHSFKVKSYMFHCRYIISKMM